MSDPLNVDYPVAGLAVLTLNRPTSMNALSIDLRRSLVTRFSELERDSIRVVILTGEGRAFCAGLDLAELGEDSSALSREPALNPVAAILRFSGIVIAAVNGAAITGGLEIALACDIIIASSLACFADTHLRVGVLPGWGLSQRLSRTIGIYRAKQMALTGQHVDAVTAERWGIATEVSTPEKLLGRARELADVILTMSPANVRTHKRLIDHGYELTLAEGLRLETERAATYNDAVTPTDVASRKGAVIAHGRNRALT